MDAEKLARFRVDHGSGGYRAMEMTEDEKAARRAYIFGILRDKTGWNLTSKQVDDIRIFQMGNLLVLEDAEFVERII